MQAGHLTPGYSVRHGSLQCCPFLLSSQEDEETETCTVNLNFTKSTQANCQNSLEKGRGVLSIVHHLPVLLPPLFTVLVQRQESSSLLGLYSSTSFFVLSTYPAGTWRDKELCGQYVKCRQDNPCFSWRFFLVAAALLQSRGAAMSLPTPLLRHPEPSPSWGTCCRAHPALPRAHFLGTWGAAGSHEDTHLRERFPGTATCV